MKRGELHKMIRSFKRGLDMKTGRSTDKDDKALGVVQRTFGSLSNRNVGLFPT